MNQIERERESEQANEEDFCFLSLCFSYTMIEKEKLCVLRSFTITIIINFLHSNSNILLIFLLCCVVLCWGREEENFFFFFILSSSENCFLTKQNKNDKYIYRDPKYKLYIYIYLISNLIQAVFSIIFFSSLV